MIALSLDPARAALVTQGVVRAVSVKTRPREMPAIVAVYAKNGPLSDFGRFWVGGLPSSRVLFDDEGGPTRTLHPGCVVGTAELVDVVPLKHVEGRSRERRVEVDENEATLFTGAVGPSEFGPLPLCEDITDQLPFLDLSLPYVALLGAAWPTTSRCPRCEGRGWGRVEGGYPDDTRCWVCGGEKGCDPIRVPKGLRTWGRWDGTSHRENDGWRRDVAILGGDPSL